MHLENKRRNEAKTSFVFPHHQRNQKTNTRRTQKYQRKLKRRLIRSWRYKTAVTLSKPDLKWLGQKWEKIAVRKGWKCFRPIQFYIISSLNSLLLLPKAIVIHKFQKLSFNKLKAPVRWLKNESNLTCSRRNIRLITNYNFDRNTSKEKFWRPSEIQGNTSSSWEVSFIKKGIWINIDVSNWKQSVDLLLHLR